jgi:hypothetical protein
MQLESKFQMGISNKTKVTAKIIFVKNHGYLGLIFKNLKPLQRMSF